VRFRERPTEPGVVYGSKAVGEPPLMLAISVREALKDAVGFEPSTPIDVGVKRFVAWYREFYGV